MFTRAKAEAAVIVLLILAASAAVIVTQLAMAQQPAQQQPPAPATPSAPRPADRQAFLKWAEERWGKTTGHEELDFQLLTVRLVVADVEVSLDHYHKLGFTLASYKHAGADAKISEASMGAGRARLELRSTLSAAAPKAPRHAATILFYIEGKPGLEDNLRSLTAFRSELLGRGLKVSELRDNANLVEFFVEDPDGYLVGFNTNRT